MTEKVITRQYQGFEKTDKYNYGIKATLEAPKSSISTATGIKRDYDTWKIFWGIKEDLAWDRLGDVEETKKKLMNRIRAKLKKWGMILNNLEHGQPLQRGQFDDWMIVKFGGWQGYQSLIESVGETLPYMMLLELKRKPTKEELEKAMGTYCRILKSSAYFSYKQMPPGGINDAERS